MISTISRRYQKPAAWFMLLIFYSGMIGQARPFMMQTGFGDARTGHHTLWGPLAGHAAQSATAIPNRNPGSAKRYEAINVPLSEAVEDIGGPSQPEMASFKTAGADNMVNLFTGDFSYNIPLMDVGGYPINIFYDGNVSLEQEASWVGLGWNINPGNISRNMRGVPDDFKGEEMIQTQQMKPNKTWGVSFGGNFEAIGISDFLGLSLSTSLGVSINNYLGPAVDVGLGAHANFSIPDKAKSEKPADTSSASSLGLNLGVSANLNSRSGLTLSPNFSMAANSFHTESKIKERGSGSFGLSTSYNSRTGINSLQLSGQMSFEKTKYNEKGKVENRATGSRDLFTNSISFARPSYTPALRPPLTNSSISGKVQVGGSIFGAFTSFNVDAYGQQSRIMASDVTQKKPMIGYIYGEHAMSNPQAVMDFTRLGDREVTRNTSVISAPQYTYDVFSIQGEGTGGSVRAYRNDQFYIMNNISQTQDESFSVGFDAGIPGQYGGNFSTYTTPTIIGGWNEGNLLRDFYQQQNSTVFASGAGYNREKVYFRNPGEATVIHPDQFNSIGGLDLVRFKLGGSKANPSVQPVLEKFSKEAIKTGELNLTSAAAAPELSRRKRTQVFNFLTAAEAKLAGLDRTIKSYDPVNILSNQALNYSSIQRDADYRKPYHISEIDVTESNGNRYMFGLPVYNKGQYDISFSVDKTTSYPSLNRNIPEKIAVTDLSLLTANSPAVASESIVDGFYQRTYTPPYAHSFLLTGILSPDYVDVTGNGITEDDLGTAVKFNYTQYPDYVWRTPFGNQLEANFNAGKMTDKKDDKGIISIGTRESWYLHSLESKSMIAIFTLDDRDDGNSSNPISSTPAAANDPIFQSAGNNINTTIQARKALKRIDLYNKADIKRNGLGSAASNAKPIKTVWFDYDYSLCNNTPDNHQSGGKLTLTKIYFTFKGKHNRQKPPKYVFSYNNNGEADNPDYAAYSTDRWGTYKPKEDNPTFSQNTHLTNVEYPYSVQNKYKADANAGAWALKKILIPSGAQINVEYESDDYAFVQDKRACVMMPLAGLSHTSNFSQAGNLLYQRLSPEINENNFVFIEVPENFPANPSASVVNKAKEKYIGGQQQLAFKLTVEMPNGREIIPCYANIKNFGIANAHTIWIELSLVNDKISPLSLTAVEFLREQLPGQAFPNYDMSGQNSLGDIAELLVNMFENIKSAVKNPLSYLRGEGKAQVIDLSTSFVRLNDPDGFKYGGGSRVKKITMKDNWNTMSGQYQSEYEQRFTYTTKEVMNGEERTISSGVASYEPAIGGEENPFQTIIQIRDKVPLGPASYGAIEMPILDAFFPAPGVGYSRVMVQSAKKGNFNTSVLKSRSGIGTQVTEYYTAKDFPVFYKYTPFDPLSDFMAHSESLGAFFYKYAFDMRAMSQGFIVVTNDMHGKMKRQASYGENDPTTVLSYMEYYYKNTGVNGMDDKVDFVYPYEGAVIRPGNMGVDVELMTDCRALSTYSTGYQVQGQIDLFPVVLPFWLLFPWPVSSESENSYRAVTTTKVVNFHSIVDKVLVMDKGSKVVTENLVYDSETGQVIVTKYNNEYDMPVYSTSYPAYWAYSGMGPAYQNIDVSFTADIREGTMISMPAGVFESGDELLLEDPGTDPVLSCPVSLLSEAREKLWVVDRNKNTTSLTNPNPEFIFVDKFGKLYNKNNVRLRIVRSGKRNLLNGSLGSAITQASPMIIAGNIKKLEISQDSRVLQSSAVEYHEKWYNDPDVFRKIRYQYVGCSSVLTETPDCSGDWERAINPYLKGLLGNFKPRISKQFYGSRFESALQPGNSSNPNPNPTNLPVNGILEGFSMYWNYNANQLLVPDEANSKWVTSDTKLRFNAKGMELETKNALNIYTSALYGFNKTVPTAIANNARYNEIFSTGFEDLQYDESLNAASMNSCFPPRFDMGDIFPDMGAVVESGNNGLLAHSGNRSLKIMPGKTIPLNFSVGNELPADFEFENNRKYQTNLTTPGGNYHLVYVSPGPFQTQFCHFSSDPGYSAYQPNPNFGMYMRLGGQYVPEGEVYTRYSFEARTVQYLQINDDGVYDFQLKITIGNGAAIDLNPDIEVEIYNMDNAVTMPWTIQQSGVYSEVRRYCLPKGVYRVTTTCTQDFRYRCPCGGASFCNTGSDAFEMRLINSPTSSGLLTTYKNIDNQQGCSAPLPIPALETMTTPDQFSPTPGKKMWLSAWVKQTCTSGNAGDCAGIEVVKNNGQPQVLRNIYPVGPVIDGWQKIEGSFEVPTDADVVSVNINNNTSADMYIDDIRIHPLQANLKSFVYDDVNLRLMSELDENNFASFYEYDAEGQLIRVKKETNRGVKTISETRSHKQLSIENLQ